MTALPLSDRVLFALSRQSATVRGLSQLLRTDRETVRKTVWGLEEQSLVERAHEGPPILFHAAPDIEVEYRPSRILVHRSGNGRKQPPERTPASADGRCSAVTTRGHRCKLRAVAGGHCSYHAPAIEL